MTKRDLVIAVDFDGTMVTHDYPKIGTEVPGAIDTVKALMKKNVKIILWTMRNGDKLKEAVDWCTSRGIEFYGVNENPSQVSWSNSPKAYAHIYIDDAALGCPLTEISPSSKDRQFVNWEVVSQLLSELGIL